MTLHARWLDHGHAHDAAASSSASLWWPAASLVGFAFSCKAGAALQAIRTRLGGGEAICMQAALGVVFQMLLGFTWALTSRLCWRAWPQAEDALWALSLSTLGFGAALLLGWSNQRSGWPAFHCLAILALWIWAPQPPLWSGLVLASGSLLIHWPARLEGPSEAAPSAA